MVSFRVKAMNNCAESIRPLKSGQADFFSWQLYRWARSHPERLEIWEFNQSLYIGISLKEGNDLWLHGRKFTELCTYGKKLNSFAFLMPSDAKDVTENFWERYFKIGVCAIHGDFAHRWNTNDKERTCINCGKVQTKHIRIKEYEVWI